MKSILRYEAYVDDGPQHYPFRGEVRKVASIRRVVNGRSRAVVEFWAETGDLMDDATPVRRTLEVFGTGHPIPVEAVWRGTCDRNPEGDVWHLYELTGGGK
jgi:hypothetical protein